MKLDSDKSKNYIRPLVLVLVVLFSFLLAGYVGVLAAFFMYWLSRANFATDSQAKHGISHQSSSRLGGVAVLITASVINWALIGIELPYDVVEQITIPPAVLVTAILIGAIGLYDDISLNFPPYLRLVTLAVVFSACFFISPELVPVSVGVSPLDYLISWRPIAMILALISCLALVNASNMADGANGLMPLIFAGTFSAYFTLTHDLIYLAVAAATFVFVVFNLFTGKLFLGDFGSYGLGALAALGALSIVAQSEASLWFFLCLASYPVIDFFASLIRRVSSGKSPLSPDDEHLHNMLYRFNQQHFSYALCSNSLCGLCISLGSTGVAILCMLFWSPSSVNWAILFAVQIVLYLMVRFLLNRSSARNSPAG